MSQAAELSGEGAPTTADHLHPIPIGPVLPSAADDRRFWYGLVLVAALHVLLVIGFGTSPPRRMGEPEGSLEGVSVELIDAADFLSRTTVPLEAAPGASATPPAPAPAAPRTAPAEARPEPSPVETEAEHPAEDAQQAAKEVTPSALQEVAPDLFSLPDPTPKQSDSSGTPGKSRSAPPRKPAPPQRLSMPDMPMPSAGRAAAVGRPPGITRSGENDDFGRGVVRALRQTMPPPDGQAGRVTIRLLLSMRGNLDEVRLIKGSGIPALDQSVIFAARQSSFPFPPKNATVNDRTFLVTYIYD